MVRAVALLALLAGAATPQPEPWVRIAAPADGADVELAGGTRLGFDFDVGGGGGVEGLVLCVQLTNKRLSYESYTHCGAASAPRTHFDLSGLLPGVWRARAFLRAGGAVGGESRRGAAVDKLKEALHNYAFLSLPDVVDWQTDAQCDRCHGCSRLMRQT